jgi:hypothetical protein
LQETLPRLVFELPEDLREAFFKFLFSMHFSHIFKTECSPLVSRDFSTLSVGGELTHQAQHHGADAAEARPLAECLSHGSLTDLELLGQICWEFGGKLGDLSDLSMDELGIQWDIM